MIKVARGETTPLHRETAALSRVRGDGIVRLLEVHGPELAALGNPWRAFSTLAHREPAPLPGEWPADAHPPRDSVRLGWQRLTELWFQSFAEWRDFIDASSRLTPPPWARAGADYPWLRPGLEIASCFLLERPNDEFARDARGYL